MPLIHFYKFLAKRNTKGNNDMHKNKFEQLNLPIPDTIVYNDQQDPYWIYSNYEVFHIKFIINIGVCIKDNKF
jgi:hypothetical protein